MSKKPTSNALELLDRLIGDNSELRAMIEEERVSAQVAREIHDLRTSRGLSQKQLAEIVGTKQSAIARLEDANYEGHSLRMLQRIAEALNAHLTVHLVPDEALDGALDLLIYGEALARGTEGMESEEYNDVLGIAGEVPAPRSGA